MEEREFGSAGPKCPLGASPLPSCDARRSTVLPTLNPFHDRRFRDGDAGCSVGDEGSVAECGGGVV